MTINIIDSFPPFSYTFIVTNAATSNVIFSSTQGSAFNLNSTSFTVPMEANAIGNVIVTGNVVDFGRYDMLATNSFVISSNSDANVSAPSVVPTTTIEPSVFQVIPSSGEGGGSVAAVTSVPAVVPYLNGNETGYEILNFSQFDSETVSYNTTLLVSENFITPTSAGISLNGYSFTLSPGAPVMFMNTTRYSYFAELSGISYLPIQHTVTVLIYRQPNVMSAPRVTTIPVTTAPTIVSTTIAVPFGQNATGSLSESPQSNSTLFPLMPWIGEGVAIAIAIGIGVAYPRMASRQKKRG